MIDASNSSRHAAADPATRLAINVATASMVVMPLAMWLASRSAPLFLVVAAVCCLIALAREPGRFAHHFPIMAGGSPDPLAAHAGRGVALGVLGFFLLALLSILWSHDAPASLKAYGELAISVVSGAIVAAVLPARSPRWAGRALVAALVLSCLLTVLELRGLNVWRAQAGLRTHTFVFNRTLIMALLVALPALAWLAAGRRWPAFILLGVTVGAALLVSESGAGKLGLGVAILAALVALLAPRAALLAGVAGLVALFALAPVQGEIAERTLPAEAHRQLQAAHSRDRVNIWLAYGVAIRERPLLGSGFGTSPTLHRHPVAQSLPEADRPWLSVGHPHSAPVQIWTETGLAGAAALLLAGLNLLALIGRMSGPWRPAAFGVLAGALAISTVGHGAWQGWWIAGLGASVVWFRVLMAQSRRDCLSEKAPET